MFGNHTDWPLYIAHILSRNSSTCTGHLTSRLDQAGFDCNLGTYRECICGCTHIYLFAQIRTHVLSDGRKVIVLCLVYITNFCMLDFDYAGHYNCFRTVSSMHVSMYLDLELLFLFMFYRNRS